MKVERRRNGQNVTVANKQTNNIDYNGDLSLVMLTENTVKRNCELMKLMYLYSINGQLQHNAIFVYIFTSLFTVCTEVKWESD